MQFHAKSSQSGIDECAILLIASLFPVFFSLLEQICSGVECGIESDRRDVTMLVNNSLVHAMMLVNLTRDPIAGIDPNLPREELRTGPIPYTLTVQQNV
ncbi:hypothetical protein TMatcc_005007 [Talaromyces marneffei ATCC 18224]|uniref:uncharacterized protein n=1 Tax=Talaromyces marneffei TaxID=37727 RepID=UPI0012A976D3|nr:uncharacterized protein EYB26_000081 [Talaromyces marneffei]KAE8557549.1 hypothetical protein EYB25_002256 [Talaromyces marneffei]QGA12437.1 hypothetical protein EYB26_000081 [Talaromyces marneffei]